MSRIQLADQHKYPFPPCRIRRSSIRPFLTVDIFEKYLGKNFFWGSKERLTRNIFRKYFSPKFYSCNIFQQSAAREIFRAQIFLGQQIFGQQIFGGGSGTRGAAGDVQHPAGLKVNRRRESEANKKPATHVPHTTYGTCPFSLVLWLSQWLFWV